jgi:hypothetical protein
MDNLEEQVYRKYLDVKEASEWEIDTDEGWVDINSVSLTKEYEVWSIKTEKNKVLNCADDHIVFKQNNEQIFVKNLIVGDEILTKDGLEKIISIENKHEKENMFDLDLNNENKRFYTNDILSHNSTVCGLYCLWYAMYSEEPVNIFVLANKAKSAQGLLNDIKIAYEEIEPYLKRGIVEYNKTAVEFDNRSTISTGATTKDSLRGESASFLVLDEFAHVQPHIADEFYQAVSPTISTGGKIAIISTPNGNNGKFYDIFTEAEKGLNGFAHFTINWRDVPRFGPGGVSISPDEFRDQTIKDTSLQSWLQEHECNFLGSSRTLLSADCLQMFGKMVERLDPIANYDHWDCWEKPKEGHIYLIGGDVAKGTLGDYSTLQIFDITNQNVYKQVGVYANNEIDPYDFAQKVEEIGRLYNNAYVIIESNTYGHEVCRNLHEQIQYENLFKEYKSKHFGVTANVKTKGIGTTLLKKYAENNQLILNDKETYKELCNFIESKPEVYNCPKGGRYHDDRVMALVWVCYFLNSDFWKEWESFIRQEVLGQKININTDESDMFTPFIFDDSTRTESDEFFDELSR